MEKNTKRNSIFHETFNIYIAYMFYHKLWVIPMYKATENKTQYEVTLHY